MLRKHPRRHGEPQRDAGANKDSDAKSRDEKEIRLARNHGKHQLEEPSENRRERGFKRPRLTASNLRRLRQESGSDDVSGHIRMTLAGSESSSTTTTDRLFGEALQNNNIHFEPPFTEEPDDFEELAKALSQERELPSTAAAFWRKISRSKRDATTGKLSLESRVIESMLLAQHMTTHCDYLRHRNDAWTEVDNEITAGISDAKPDVSESYSWPAYPKAAKDDFDDLIMCQYNVSMPTFAMESKGPAGLSDRAVKQAAYDGAIMTHAALAVDSILGRDSSEMYRKTKAITVTLDASAITVYANHAVLVEESGKTVTHYHQHRVAQIQYLLSEHEWNRAHSLLYNAQQLAYRLATLRVEAIERYYHDEEQVQAGLEAKQAELQKQARYKLPAAVAATVLRSKIEE